MTPVIADVCHQPVFKDRRLAVYEAQESAADQTLAGPNHAAAIQREVLGDAVPREGSSPAVPAARLPDDPEKDAALRSVEPLTQKGLKNGRRQSNETILIHLHKMYRHR